METRDLYLLQDGTQADPSECERGKDGVLRHKNGPAVCLKEDGTPQTIGETAEVGGNVAAANAGKDAPAKLDELPLGAKPGVRAQDVKAGELKPTTLARDTKAD